MVCCLKDRSPTTDNNLVDPTRIVAQSISSSKPIVLVTFNYRLNIFAFGNGGEHKNLALKDQKLAIDWVINNISEFGGDPVSLEIHSHE